MQLRRRTRDRDPGAGILPLINVVFLLLIFFMLAGQLTAGAPFKVTPPVSRQAAAAERPASAPREAAVLVAADGRLALNGQPMDPAALKAAVSADLAQHPDLPVNLKADGAAEAAAVVAVMETLRDAGVRRLQLFAEASLADAVTQQGGAP